MQRYQKRISGPMMDRIDIHLEIASVEVEKLAGLAPGEPSSAIRQRVEAAYTLQQRRFDRLNKPGIRCNNEMGPAEVQTYRKPDKESLAMMRMAVERMGLSARGRIIACSSSRARLPTSPAANAYNCPTSPRHSKTGLEVRSDRTKIPCRLETRVGWSLRDPQGSEKWPKFFLA